MNGNFCLLLTLIGSLSATMAFADVEAKGEGSSEKISLVKCIGEKDGDWVQSRREAIAGESLFQFAIKQAGLPASCEGKMTTATEEGQFGTLIFKFKNGAMYTIETLPPETSIVTLSLDRGFTDASEAIRQIKNAALKAGLHVDWSKPDIERSGDTETKTFWDPDEGTNGRGFLSYRKDKLVSVGFGMAL